MVPTQFGVFLAPFHADFASPTVLIRENLDIVEQLDRLGYEEVWVGEHHSAGIEIIASPEVFIAAAAERTRRIRLGTGVISLPYHGPFQVAHRIAQLDHQTLGRVMFGVGPGQLPSDAYMFGINPEDQRDRMRESLDVIVRLLKGEVVTETSEWYSLVEARLQLLPFQSPYPELAVASTLSPTGARVAGKYNAGLRKWRVVAPMHLAESTEQAEADVRDGLYAFARRFAVYQGMLDAEWASSPDAALAAWRHEGIAALGSGVVGTPDDAIAQIERFVEISGGFGTFLLLAHNTASLAATLRSYDLFARYVVPHFRGANMGRSTSIDWCATSFDKYLPQMMKAVETANAPGPTT
ncbi:MAG: LLM class flavin-dependent oxidoreductase [Actinobacteria bacterium]|nr:MAG: LLM class flavin-dependent oxidoreductase [Actinomycetota bacterium]